MISECRGVLAECVIVSTDFIDWCLSYYYQSHLEPVSPHIRNSLGHASMKLGWSIFKRPDEGTSNSGAFASCEGPIFADFSLCKIFAQGEKAQGSLTRCKKLRHLWGAVWLVVGIDCDPITINVTTLSLSSRHQSVIFAEKSITIPWKVMEADYKCQQHKDF